jgi:hypothetical protein
MRLELSPGSCVLIDLRASGLLRAVGHDPTLTAVPPSFALDVPDAGPGAFQVAVDARFPAEAIEPSAGLTPSESAQMRDNLCGRDVLDAARWPTVDFRGRYAGTLTGGTLSGDLVVRGVPRPLSIEVTVSRDEEALVATGAWEGTLSQLGIKPFKALLGALKLKDWIRLRLDARFLVTIT